MSTKGEGARPYSKGLVPEVDYPILRELPPVGSNIGLKPMGATVSYLLRTHPEWGLTPYEATGRLNSMQELGLAVAITIIPTSRGKGWQITKAGELLLASLNGKEGDANV